MQLFQALGDADRHLVVHRSGTPPSLDMALQDSTNQNASSHSSRKKQKLDSNKCFKLEKHATMEVITLLDTDDEDEDSTAKSDDDIMEITNNSSSWRNAASSEATGVGNLKDDGLGGNANGDDEDDELEIVGTKGQNALVDFPHSRENCLQHPFGGEKKLHCSNCFCYVSCLFDDQ